MMNQWNNVISSYVLRITVQEGEGQNGIRIRLSHVQSGEEVYVSSLDEAKAYIEDQLEAYLNASQNQ
jgi:hypothetical protein